MAGRSKGATGGVIGGGSPWCRCQTIGKFGGKEQLSRIYAITWSLEYRVKRVPGQSKAAAFGGEIEVPGDICPVEYVPPVNFAWNAKQML